MVNKKKTRKRHNLRKRLKSRKRSGRIRTVRKKLKKDILSITDMFKTIDIDPVEDILELLLIGEQKEYTT
jgi:hypothetical protein